MSNAQEEYKHEVMLTCKILLDSLSEGNRLELSELVGREKSRMQFVANIVKFGDTFRSDSTSPIYGLLFTTEGEDYLLRQADAIGVNDKSRVRITIEPLGELGGD